MANSNEKIVPVDIEEEMKGSYIDYSMSVIVARALPDVRDGLKPVHRRVLYGMQDLGLASNRAYKKSARIVGEVLGKYHPHGDSAVYDSMVRMVQDFSLRYPLVDGQGNFGSVDGDSPAAMRYTEARLSKIAEEMLRDLEKNTADFTPNFDDTLKEPSVLPALFPNLLCNGASGIAVGMATNIPPHNLNEVIDACIGHIKDAEITNAQLMKHVLAPDFPTGGIIYGYRDANAEVVLNNLYKHTQMQTTFGIIMLSLVEGRPRILTLKEMIQKFVEHRNEVVVRRSKFELDEAEKRAHILEGYIIALDNIDAVIRLIKQSKDVDAARLGLMKKFKLSEIQAKAILDMRLQKLTGLERKKVEAEYRETIKLIERLKAILKSKQLQMKIIEEELLELKKKYGDERRTEIVYKAEEFSIEDMIAEEEVVITISHQGFIKRFPVSGYRRQSRGGKGVTGAATKEDDFLEHMFVASTHNYILFFTNAGRCYWLKVFEIPEAGRMAKGKPINSLIGKADGETINAFITAKEFDDQHYVFMVTELGLVKKVLLSEFSNPRKSGITATTLRKNDVLKDARLTDGKQDIIIGTRDGISIRFHEDEVRPMGRSAAGVRGISLGKKDKVVGVVNLRRKGTTILVATEGGYGKRSEEDEYRVSHRGGKGIITVKTSDKTGMMVTIKEAFDSDDVVVVTTNGMIIRQHASDIRVAGRNTQGVRLIRLHEGDAVADVAIVMAEEEEEKRLAEKEAEKKDNGMKNGKQAPVAEVMAPKEAKKPEVKPKQEKKAEKKQKRSKK
ncbi:MAG: DNA gyrase subunit A [Ignavibacteriales bacterium]|nr:DNA gyrase subunit A [Ignavibacteriales bacterium]